MRASSGRYIGMSVIFQRPKDVFTGRPQDVGRGRPFALHIDLMGASIGHLFGPSSGPPRKLILSSRRKLLNKLQKQREYHQYLPCYLPPV